MDGINVATQQPKMVDMGSKSSVGASESSSQAGVSLVQEAVTKTVGDSSKIESEKDVENLVEKLNKAVESSGISIKFGVDRDDVFYVSVIDKETSDVIRRFPAEKGMDFVDNMEELTGMLVDFMA